MTPGKGSLLGEFFKKSSQLVHQISDQISDQMPQKIQANFSHIGFSAKIEGVDSKLSVFRAIQVSPDNSVQDNQVVGCQWFGVKIFPTVYSGEPSRIPRTFAI